MPTKTTEQRFWEKVNKTDSCWLWTGAKRNKGYGAFVYAKDGEVIQGRAHRYSYEIHKGDIPTGMFVLHSCDNPACVNPAHLALGSNQDNVTDMMKKGRHVSGGTYREGDYERGEGHHAAKLTEDDVRAIRADRDSGMSFGNLSKKYGIAVGHIFRIVTRKAWPHVS